MTTQKKGSFSIPKSGETFIGEDGTISQVLDDVVDENYEPTQGEIEDYAEWLGMKLPEDKMFLWMAREGLKAQLPQEWKPCRTDDDEIYYFNFKTGESTWKHPMDTVYQKRFKEAKKQQSDNQSKASPSNSSRNCSSTSSQGNSAPQSQAHQKPPPCSQSVIMKTKSNANLSHSTTTDSTKRVLEDAMARQVPVAAYTALPIPERCTIPTSASLTSGGSKMVLPIPSFPNESTSVTLAASQSRIVSESETALEETIRAQVKESFEAEKVKAQNLQKATLEAMRKQHEDELREIREENAKRNGVDEDAGVVVEEGDEFRAYNIAEARAYLDKKYSSRLADLEKETKSLEAQLKELRMDKSRKEDLASRNLLAAERETASDKESMTKGMDLEMEDYLEDKKKELDALFKAKSDEIKMSAKATLEREKQTLDNLFQQKEAQLSSSIEMTRKRLIMEKEKIEASIRNMTNVLSSADMSSSSSPGAESNQGNLAALNEIITKGDSTCVELRVKAPQEEEEWSKEEDALLASLRAQLSEKPASPPLAILEDSTKNIQKQVSEDVTHFPNAAVGSVEIDTEYNAQLAALRAKYDNEKERALERLSKEREVKLRALCTENSKLSQPPASGATLTTTAEETSNDSTIHELKDQHAAKLSALEARYRSLEEDLAKRLAAELENARACGAHRQAKDCVQEAVDTDMDLHIKQESALRECFPEEFDTSREKTLTETEPHEVQMLGDLNKVAPILTEVAEAEEKEKAVLAESTKLALESRRLQYLEEEKSLRNKIDAEVEAYFAAEKENLILKINNTSVGSNNSSGDAQCLEKLISERRDLFLSQQAELAQLVETLKAKQLKAHELKESLSNEVESESPNDFSELTTEASASILKDVHEARMAALEEGYREQEETLQKELAELSRRKTAIIHEGVSSGIHKTPQNIPGNRSVYQSQTLLQSIEPAATDELSTSPQGMTVSSDFQASDALWYWKQQRDYVAERHRDLESLRQGHSSPEVSGTQKEPFGSLFWSPSAVVAPPFTLHSQEPLCRTQWVGMVDSHHLHTSRSSELLSLSIDGLNNRLSNLVSTVTGRRHMPLKQESKSQLRSTHSDALKKKWDHAFKEYFFSITETPDAHF
ncbi:unnamed protein product [Phytomonas sp. Hart1]|nr:unnamed protein product [Phytomonas sp. Hart1]|eukprot:CCW68596.1 unnamed protein product [Phytomonas sp. isolate Hart1]